MKLTFSQFFLFSFSSFGEKGFCLYLDLHSLNHTFNKLTALFRCFLREKSSEHLSEKQKVTPHLLKSKIDKTAAIILDDTGPNKIQRTKYI